MLIRIHFILIYALLLLAIPSHLFAGGTIPVEPNHWAYDIVDRFVTAGYLRGFSLDTRPYNRSEFVDIILRVDSLSTEGDIINRKDMELLQKLKSEFEFELNDIGIWPENIRGQYHVLSWYGDDYRWVVDPVAKAAGYQTYSDNPESNWFTNTSTTGVVSHGYFRDDIDFYIYARDTRIGRLNDFNTIDEINIDNEGITSVTWEGNSASYDRTYASLSARLKWLDVRIGRIKHNWGPSRGYGLLLSRYALPFDMVMLQYPGKQVRATFVTGSLQTNLIDSTMSYDTDAKYRENYKKKYIASHRLEVMPWKNVSFAFSETAIYGERGYDLGYLIPNMFFWSEQHYLGDRDNLLISFDASYVPIPRYRLYGALLLDDLSLNKLGGNHWGNKWAAQAGVEIVDPIGVAGLMLTTEYVRIEPYTYTHFFSVNTYSNHEQFLGYPLQPNSDRWFAKADYWLNPLIRFKTSFERVRHGANPPGENVGGNILLGHREGDPLTKEFLAGIKDNRWGLTVSGSYEFFPEAFMELSYRFQRTDYDDEVTNESRILASISYRYY
ncbi:MAG: hypothetical protein GF315_10595 [candidate division Zixibacteria bacterium]|nr:hypothetical protein [candidate division Zixibacteria bacterium]